MFGHRYHRESGAVVVSGQHVASTQQCVHCGKHEMILQGSGKKRGWCMSCGGFVCGRQVCMAFCIPYEAKLEYQEAQAQGKLMIIQKLVSRYPQIQAGIL